MTLALACYSSVFMRYALAVSPKNYLLFGCHVINFSSQAAQGYRFLNYWKYVLPIHTFLYKSNTGNEWMHKILTMLF
jgi:hypothetical protein